MKTAYLLTTYPSRTETFAAREISSLRRGGVAVFILAAQADASVPVGSHDRDICYRPNRYGLASLLELAYLIKKYPLGFMRLMYLIARLVFHSPAESARIVLNLTAIARFTLFLDSEGIRHLHAYFFSWPATMALAICSVSKRTYSISGHARDLFVDSGAMKLKVSAAVFVTTCSRYSLDYLKKHLPADQHSKLYLLYHGLPEDDLVRLTSKSNTKKLKAPHLLAVARLSPKKGLPVLLHAFGQVRKMHPEVKLTIIGDGPQKCLLQQLTDDLDLSSAVNFLGYLPNNDIQRYMHASSILIVPSVQAGDRDCDGVPNVILEAFAASLPVIASDIGGISEAIIHQKTGLLVTPDDAQELAGAIIALLGDGELQNSLTQQGASHLEERFNLEKNLRPLLDQFRGVMS